MRASDGIQSHTAITHLLAAIAAEVLRPSPRVVPMAKKSRKKKARKKSAANHGKRPNS